MIGLCRGMRSEARLDLDICQEDPLSQVLTRTAPLRYPLDWRQMPWRLWNYTFRRGSNQQATRNNSLHPK